MISLSHFRSFASLWPTGLLASLLFATAATAQSSPDQSTPGQSAHSLPLSERIDLERKLTFAPADFVVPAVEAGAIQEFPPSGYPKNWYQGIGGFARNYGANFAMTSTAGVGRFAADAIMRHDPRYYPSTSVKYRRRFLHAIAFTVADNTNSGHRALAYGNFTGAFAAGGISIAMYPHGFNNFAHATERFNLQLLTFAGHNLFAEFAPEAVRVARFFRVPNSLANSLLPPDRKQP